ncbi:aminopeptidase [Lysinibacillus fusiformis]|jgi:leucyl aminopeptidase (aminopeptidase T)|uniref:aminopeptidase n=1 Tax=Lysinibacillus TaxID=400634 RepID=UPI0004D97E15|nr:MULTISPECIES: aminopeptidase [Lysinibacillus]AJK86716.1 aminopeptidase [Lysinibacillus fusiformis]KEK13137.1 aminopeptidase [Lysinibacillus sphaericus]KGA81627.1 aminopeptidase [Lysinibacillus fusiformis]KHK56772.1 aminopeptidase [Lysinibacillus sp. A1]MCE4044996.1 aminopeptidase [Lysinibacillus fusiformis]
MQHLHDIALKVLKDHLNVQSSETLLILTDVQKQDLATIFYEAGLTITANTMLMVMPLLEKSGQEPIHAVSSLMANADVSLCLTSHSLTHTAARKNACEKGGRVATMPGITLEMLEQGALHADAQEIEEMVEKYVQLLDKAAGIRIVKDGHELTFSVENRLGIRSTGVIRQAGEHGNIPSGESYIAPIESSANGEILVDGSIANIGVLKEPLLLKISNGRLVEAIGPDGPRLLELLGEENGRIIAEFGIGANKSAMLCGNVLEDEKVYGTIHIAFGSNVPFGGANAADVHIDCVVKNPVVYFDGERVI